MINIYEPNIQYYQTSAIDAIHSGWISNHGKYIQLATDKLKQILNSKYAILMANGTCATHAIFLALNFKYPNINKIYVPNNAYVAVWNSALMVYNIDQLEVMKMDINTWNINTDEEYIKSLDVGAAVLIVHNLGNIVNVPRLKKFRPDLIFIEDNCEGLFGKYENIFSGTSEDILCSSCSFYGNKIITTGEGGAFLTNHKDVYEYILKVYSQGMSSTRYLHDVHAYNYRMTNIQAAFLYDQLNDIENILNNKRKLFENYESRLFSLIQENKVKLFEKEMNTENSHWIFALRIVGNTKSIDETSAFFKDNGIDIRPFFYPINKHGHLSSIENTDKISTILNNEIIMIPSSPSITIEQQQKVVDTIRQFILFQNIQVIKINDININLLNDFIPTIDSNHFRYFNKRTSECIHNHVGTFLFYDIVTYTYFGYTHIDYDVQTNKNWFGIYLHNSYCGKKLGNLLLNYTIHYFSKLNNNKNIHLSVDSDNEYAIKLYKKNGFIVDNDANINHKSDVLYMTKYLNS